MDDNEGSSVTFYEDNETVVRDMMTKFFIVSLDQNQGTPGQVRCSSGWVCNDAQVLLHVKEQIRWEVIINGGKTHAMGKTVDDVLT
ncbi:hypothetical protein ACE6H2_026867 [Prunus campanulata]